MTMAPTAKVVLGSIAFAIFWVMAVFPAVPFLPIGRTAGSLLGAMLMVIFQVLTPDQAYAAIDLPILGLLFGTMVVSVYLERADMFKYLGKLLSWKSRGAKDLLCRICFVSALSSALFTNDTSCVVLTEFVLKLVRQQNLPPHPFLLALASSANIGSSATPIGNPQNLVIAVQSKISFGKFLFGILPSMLVGVVINASILLCMYWKLLSDQKEDEENVKSPEAVKDDEVVSHRFSPATLSHLDSVNSQEIDAGNLESVRSPQYVNGYVNHFPSTLRNCANTGDVEKVNTNNPTSLDVNSLHVDVKEGGSRDHVALTEGDIQNAHSGSLGSSGRLDASKEDVKSQDFMSPKRSSSIIDYDSILGFAGENLGFSKKWKRVLWKVCVYLVTLGMLISLLAGMDMSWSAITAALALVVLDFEDARPCLEKVSYSLLVFFCGMFITVDGFNKTGIPSTLWDIMEPYSKINRIGGTIVLAVVILVLSNVASNVPTVLLLGARVAASASNLSPSSEKKAWLILAWVSTVAGNLSLLGSAANLIVCEQARRAQHCGYNLSFWTHLKFGFPSTLIITAIGLILIRG